MPTKPDPRAGINGERLVDTSVAVALLVEDHEGRESTVRALSGFRLGLCGHAAFETFSVLTRLPGRLRRPPAVVAQLLSHNFPATVHLGPERARNLMADLGPYETSGGSVYDALVAVAAAEHGGILASRDRRALSTYRAFGIEVDVLD